MSRARRILAAGENRRPLQFYIGPHDAGSTQTCFFGALSKPVYRPVLCRERVETYTAAIRDGRFTSAPLPNALHLVVWILTGLQFRWRVQFGVVQRKRAKLAPVAFIDDATAMLRLRDLVQPPDGNDGDRPA